MKIKYFVHVKNVFQVNVIPNYSPKLEIISVTLQLENSKSCMSLHLLLCTQFSCRLELNNYLESLNTAHFSNYILLGDFNVDLAASGSPWQHRMLDLDVTHVHHCGISTLIDLAFKSNIQLLQTCSLLPPLENSDHSGIHLQIKWKARSHSTTAGRTVWRNAQADWEKACEQSNAIDWNSLLSDNIDVSTLV